MTKTATTTTTTAKVRNHNENSSGLKKYTWKEVNDHRASDDCWIVVKGKVYDVTSWVPKHPGGDMILYGGGRDATPFFIPYHPLKVQSILDKYLIGELVDYKPFYSWNSEFYTVVKERVEAVMKEKNVNSVTYEMYLKTFVIFLFWGISYYYSMIQGYIIASFIFGFFNAHMGISISHDGCHGSYSKNKYVNQFAAFMTDMMGGSWVIWTMQHNIGHHPHANRLGDYEDEDFDPDSRSGFPLVRLSPYYIHRSYHKYQHYYIWLLFPWVGIKWMYGDMKYFLKGKYQTMEFWDFSPNLFYYNIITKVIFISHSVILPLYLHGLIRGLILVSILFAVNSYVFALLFAVNHLTTESIFPHEDMPEKDWAKLQVMTSSNYALDSTFNLWLSGGLNFQIEHHLFPYISHLQLPKISPVVRQTCKEYGVPYFAYPTYTDAIKGYYNHLKHLSVKPKKN